MKKTVIFGMLFLLAGCAYPFGNGHKSGKVDIPLKKESSEVAKKDNALPVGFNQQTNAVIQMPEIQNNVVSNCQILEPVVLKPRVTEVLHANNKSPNYGDNVWVEEEYDVTYVPDAPEIYVISANRAVNTIQEEAKPLLKQIGKAKIYVAEAVAVSSDLPGGIEKGTGIIKKRFAQMKNIKLAENKAAADYVIESTADWYDTPTKTVPAVKYTVSLKDRGDNLIGEWSEIVHQAEGDRSWW